MKLAVRNAEGKQLRQIEVDEAVFGIVPNTAVLHQALVAQQANRRRGTVKTKTRSEVQGSTAKIRAQKYTGRARQGSSRAPHRTGGGVAFGPRPRDYSQALPKKMRRLAIRSALSGKAADGQLVVIDRLTFPKPRTKEILRILHNVGIERSALIVTAQPDRTVLVSVRNLQKTKALPAAYLNVLDMLTHRDLLMTEEAVRVAEGLWGQRRETPAPPEEPKRRRRAAAAPAAEAPAVEAPARQPEAAPEEKPARRRKAAKAEEPAAKVKPIRRAPAEKRPRRARAETKQAEAPPKRRRRARPRAADAGEEA